MTEPLVVLRQLLDIDNATQYNTTPLTLEQNPYFQNIPTIYMIMQFLNENYVVYVDEFFKIAKA